MWTLQRRLAIASLAAALLALPTVAESANGRSQGRGVPGRTIYVPRPPIVTPREVPSPLNSPLNAERPRLQPNVRGESLDGTRIPQTDPPR